MPRESAVQKKISATTARRPVLLVLREAFIAFYNEESIELSASIAFYSVLSIFPFLLLLLGLSGFYIQHHQLAGRLAPILSDVLPMKPDFILQNIVGISRAFGRVGLISFLLLLWASSGVFVPIEKALNRAWGIEGGRSWIGRRLVALGMALLFGVLILATCGLIGLSLYIRAWMSHVEPHFTIYAAGLLYRGLLSLASFLVTLGIFVLLFVLLPNHSLRLRQIFPGAALTAVLWQVARGMFTVILLHLNYRHVYGSIGAMVAFMTWAYISSMVLLFGAQVSGTLYRSMHPGTTGSGPAPLPSDGADELYPA
ncbi:MAG TPA: YihY/virulence factor BrkB family protein [Terriglobia bacterium]|nr:YihY/virulence factor BrkB family protein [Terriglobia bacterium]